MFVRLRCLVLALVSTTIPVVAQTFVVDGSNGPGTSFTDIPAAVMNVPDGATLVIRPGAYTAFTIDAKGLTLLADAGVSVAGTTIVQNTSASQAVLIHDIDFTAATFGTGVVLHVLDCLGPVVLADLSTPANPPAELGIASYWYTPRGLVAQNCMQLVVRDCVISGVNLGGSRSVVESCILHGTDMQLTAGMPSPASAGLTIAGGYGDVIGDTQMVAGASLWNTQPAGLHAVQSLVNVRSGTISSLGGAGAGWAIASVSATVRLDPSVSVLAAIAPPTLGAVTTIAMPEVVSTDTQLGGSMQASVAAAAGDLVALFAGALGPAALVNGFADPFWLDPSAVVMQAFGVQQAGVPLTSSVAIPMLPALRGAKLVWQAATFGSGGLRTTNPSLSVVE